MNYSCMKCGKAISYSGMCKDCFIAYVDGPLAKQAAAALRERVRAAVELELLGLAVALDEKGIALHWHSYGSRITDRVMKELDKEGPR